MRTLNLRKLRWTVREMHKRELSVYRIAKQQGITPRHARRLYRRYREVELYKLNKTICLQKCGRKPKPSSAEETGAVLEVKRQMGFGAVNLEKVLSERGVKIPHNRIHRILMENGLAKKEPKKGRRRKWIRYERRHSNSLWHTDYHQLSIGRYIVPFLDDASRFILGYGVVSNETAENATIVFEDSVKRHGAPKQLVSDHGVQFASIKRKNCMYPNDNVFQRKLKEYKVRHILARVKHPQTNGKMERWFRTIETLIKQFNGDIDRAVRFYNFERPHMSLENGHLRTPYQAFIEKMRKNKK